MFWKMKKVVESARRVLNGADHPGHLGMTFPFIYTEIVLLVLCLSEVEYLSSAFTKFVFVVILTLV